MPVRVSWIAVDWGTTHLRVWAMDRANTVLAHANSDRGMGALSPGEFEPALLSLIDGWLPRDQVTPVLACGMVGARQGWVETPYEAVPCLPIGGSFKAVPCADTRIEVAIVPGLMQSDPADVMRGEETQIAGLLSVRPDFDGWVCLPGTHTKWARISDGKIFYFQSFMTGELFSLLERQSVLKHSLGGAELDKDVFEQTARQALEAPSPSIATLFSIRADDLLNGVAPEISRARLSASLIASEISATEMPADAEIVLLGDNDLVDLYRVALKTAGATPVIADGTEMTLRGLAAAKKRWEKP